MNNGDTKVHGCIFLKRNKVDLHGFSCESSAVPRRRSTVSLDSIRRRRGFGAREVILLNGTPLFEPHFHV